MKGISAIMAGLGLAVLIACGGGGGGNRGASDPTKSDSADDHRVGDKFDAQMFAEKFVKQHLKWPDDAEFPMFSQATSYDDERGQWVVTGKVKAKNALGASLTHRYRCTLYLDGNTWRCRYLQIGDDIMVADLEAETPTERRRESQEEKQQPEQRPAVSARAAIAPVPPAIIRGEEAADKLRLAELLLKAGKSEKAADRFRELIEEYPATGAAATARQHLDEFGQ